MKTLDISADDLITQLINSGWEFDIKKNQTFFDPDFNVFHGYNKEGLEVLIQNLE